MPSRVLQSALRKVSASGHLPTTLGSDEMEGIRAQIRRRAVFSATVAKTRILDGIRDVTEKVLRKEMSPLTARQVLLDTIKRTRYRAPEGKEGTIQDLTSDARLDLIVRTQVDMARGYGLLIDGQRDLENFPWWEMYRKFERVEPRDWPTRWREKGRRLRGGKMVAPVNDRIWRQISRFDTPYPPFDFNSGMSVRRVSLARGRAMGMKPPEQKPLKRLPEMAKMQSEISADPKLVDQMLRDLGPGYEVKDGVLTGKG